MLCLLRYLAAAPFQKKTFRLRSAHTAANGNSYRVAPGLLNLAAYCTQLSLTGRGEQVLSVGMGKCKAGQATGQSRCDGQPGQQRDCCLENGLGHRQSWEGARLMGAGLALFFSFFFFFLLIDSAKETAVLYSHKFCKERLSLSAPRTGS